MSLKDEFLTALRSGAGHDALLGLVHRHQANGMSPQESYRVLQQIWQESGFDGAEGDSTLQDTLEYVMEKVWYDCPA